MDEAEFQIFDYRVGRQILNVSSDGITASITAVDATIGAQSIFIEPVF